MSINEDKIDNDIKNELLELASLVTQEFSVCQDKQDVDLRDLEYESFKRDKNSDEENDEKDFHLAANELVLSNEEFKLPVVDWENLEIKLKQAQQEISIQNQRSNVQNDRDEIRRKLAMISSSSSTPSLTESNHDSIISDYMRRPSVSKNISGQNLQICFMNELADDLVEETLPDENCDDLDSLDMANSNSSFSMLSITSSDSCDTILAQLQSEAKQALAKVSIRARSKIQSEATSKKQSPIADIVGLPTYGLKRLEREDIVDMNIGQLQVIVNDLCNQIEKINEDLKILLIDRDDLYMQQDSILVDIEDITKRIKESAQKSKLLKSNVDFNECNSANLASNNRKNLVSNKEIFEAKSGDGRCQKKTKTFDLANITNKLYRFRKKN